MLCLKQGPYVRTVPTQGPFFGQLSSPQLGGAPLSWLPVLPPLSLRAGRRKIWHFFLAFLAGIVCNLERFPDLSLRDARIRPIPALSSSAPAPTLPPRAQSLGPSSTAIFSYEAPAVPSRAVLSFLPRRTSLSCRLSSPPGRCFKHSKFAPTPKHKNGPAALRGARAGVGEL